MEVSLSENNLQLKQINQSLRVYLLKRSSESSSILLEDLQSVVLGVDFNSLDPGSQVVLEFFVNLHELMLSHDEKSSVVWSAVSILEDASKHQHLKDCLVHSFKFVPVLTKLLKTRPVGERRLKILQLIQELTYGIKISWQEVHLPFLISSLTKWITGDEPALIPLSLGILVNLCYKNTPAIYTLMKSVDIKQFLKVLFTLQKKCALSKVQVCKLLIVLEEVSGELPNSAVDTYIRSTCPTLAEAIRLSNPMLMQHVIDFFKEIVTSHTASKFISDYPNYGEDIEELLGRAAGEELSEGCAAPLLDYLAVTVELGVSGLEALYPSAVQLSLRWLDSRLAASQALRLLATVTARLFPSEDSSPEKQDIGKTVSLLISQHLPAVVGLLSGVEAELTAFREVDSLGRLTAVVTLLSQLVRLEQVPLPVTSLIHLSMLRKLFEPLLQLNCNESLLHKKEIYSFYIELLSFLTVLGEKETSCLILCHELLQESQVQAVLSVALYTGSENIKKKVIYLIKTTGFSSECLELLASCMRSVSKRLVTSPSWEDGDGEARWSSGPGGLSPLLTVSQQSHLAAVLERCEAAARQHQNPLTSSIMELYQWRVSALETSQRQMEASQEAADLRAAQLQTRLVQASAEIGSLHSALRAGQLRLELATRDSSALTIQLNALRLETNDMQSKYSECLLNLRSKTVIISNQKEEIAQLKATNSDLLKDVKSLQEDIDKRQNECLNMANELTSKEEIISGLRKTTINLETSLESKNQKIDSLNKEIVEQSSAIKKLKVACSDKDNQISDLQKELAEQERMKEIISSLVTGKRKI